MKHAFLILVHKNPTQLVQMIDALQAKNSLFFVHVDGKSNIRFILKNKIDLIHNVRLCDKQIKVNWGGFSMIEATVCLMNMLCDSDFRADYVHLLSGQDFPLRSLQEIDQFFEQNCGKNFMDYYTLPYKKWAGNQGLDRVNYKWDIDNKKTDKSKLDKCVFPKGIQPYGGSQWWSFTKECVKWLVKVSCSGELLYDFYRHTMIPDEMYFQTVIMHSSFAETVVNDNLRYCNWVSGQEYPRILTCMDWDNLIHSEKLFARKFDINKDSTILNKLIVHIKQPYTENLSNHGQLLT